MMLLNFFLCIDAAKRLMHVKHDAIMHIFHLTVKTVLSKAFASLSISPEEHFERQLSEQQLYAALNSLPPKQARRIFAHYFDGISQAEIGRAEGITRESVNESLRRGLRKLKTFLENQ